MFQVGDKIEIIRDHGRRLRAEILEVQFRNNTYVCRVLRKDTGKEDVFAWNICQDELSVKKTDY